MRTAGRRKTDKYQWAAGMALGAVLTSYGLYTSGCDSNGGGTVSGPTTSTSTPVAAAPAPTPTATPSLVGVDPVSAFELSCFNNSTLAVKYNGPASRAAIETFYTSFDNQTLAFGKQSHVVATGGTVTRVYGQICIQGDADQPGVKEIGGCFFDKDGKPFIPSRNPEKVTACRTVPCDPEAKESWIEDKEYHDAENWSSCSSENAPNGVSASTGNGCYKKKTRTWTSTNICTKATRTRTIWIYAECECPCVETTEPRETPGAFAWAPEIIQGKCEVEQFPEIDTFTTPQLNCRQLGTQKYLIDWLCKADGERIRNLCRNVACPTPTATCANTAASYKAGANGGLFNLGSSSDAAELGWVNSFVGLGPWKKQDGDDDFNNECTTVDISGASSAKIAIVKAGSSQSVTWSYRTYLNVTDGQTICSYNSDKDISHVTYFVCQ